jgi:phosphonate utilization associated putative membrane protein
MVTALANTTYFLALRRAYIYAPVALVYPIARSSPILIVLWAWLIFEQGISSNGLLGISISVVGLWILSLTSKNGDTRHAIPWALIAAFSTSIYSLSDKVAVEYLPSFGSQLGFITVGYFASFIGLTAVEFKKNKKLYPECRPKLRYIVVGGLFIGTAYALVVRAMLDLPAAYVVSYTNAGIVIATVLSVWLFKERESWRYRILGALIVCLGLLWTGLG